MDWVAWPRRASCWSPKRLTLSGLLCGVASLMVCAGSLPASAAPPAAEQKDDPRWAAEVTPGRDLIRGDSGRALVTVVIFLDLRSPLSARHEPAIRQLLARGGSQVRVVYKHNPSDRHPAAPQMHRALIAAQKLGMGVPYRQLLLDHVRGPAPDVAALTRLATRLGLDATAFGTALAAPETAKHLADDMALADRLNVRMTPTSFVDGRPVVGPVGANALWAATETAIAEARADKRRGHKDYAALIRDGKTFAPLDDVRHRFPDAELPAIGPAADKARVVVTVFTDGECPACAKHWPALKGLVDAFPGKVRLQAAHFPLPYHKGAIPAAIAIEAARTQRGPAEAVALLEACYAVSTAPGLHLDHKAVAKLVAQMGLDTSKLEANAARHKAQVDKVTQAGRDAGVSGTPAVFLNGRRYKPARGFHAETLAAGVRMVLAE